MNALLLNRGDFQMPADGWYQLAPLGEFPHGGSPSTGSGQAAVVQVIDAEACQSMANRFREEAGIEPFDKLRAERFAGLLIDFDHFSLDGEKRSEAAGWIVALEARPSGQLAGGSEQGTVGSEQLAVGNKSGAGLWAKIRWSDVGEEAVKGGRYRFLSPVWARKDCVELGDGRVRPVRLLNAAVTNDPNLKGMRPLSNSGQFAVGSGQLAGSEQLAGGELANAGGGEPGERYRWELGVSPDDRHCPSCEALAGQVHTKAEWDAAGLVPGAGGLYCQGNCHCRLERTDDPARGTLGGAPQRRAGPAAALRNDAGARDARDAALAVRHAKAAVRGREAEGQVASDGGRRRGGRRESVDLGSWLDGRITHERSLRMKEKVEEKTGDGAARAQASQAGGQDIETLTNALRFEREKNQVLLEEVVALEDEIVNRALADFESVVSDETREFWREQLLSNRAAATTALNELAEARAQAAHAGGQANEGQATHSAGSGQARRPLHNRAAARPLLRQGFVGQAAADGAGAGQAGPGEDRAAKIRNRAQEISRAERVPFSAAFRRAEREISGQ